MPTDMPFDQLIPDARTFLSELHANNTRDWFMENKARYDSQLKGPSEVLLDVLASDLQQITGQHVSPKLFRQQRDIRFSKDKTPYKTHLHMLWHVGEGLGRTAFYFGIELDRIVLGGGCMGMEKDKLVAYRKRVSGAKGKDLMRAISDAGRSGIRFSEPELKRVPAPFPADHPQGDLLRHKSLTFWKDLPHQPADLRKSLKGGFASLMPLQEWLMSIR